MRPDSEPRQLNINAKESEPATSGQVFREMENHYLKAGLKSFDVEAFIDYTNVHEAMRDLSIYLKKVGSNEEDEDLFLEESLTGRLEDISKNTVLKNEANNEYIKKFTKAKSFSDKLHKAYIAEGNKASVELDYKVIGQFVELRDRLETEKTKLSENTSQQQ